MSIEVTTGNAFEALGYTREEANLRAMRVYLAAEIRKHVQKNKLTQAEAAEFFGVTQPRISNVLNMKLDRFTIDFLVKMLSRTDRIPHLTFRAPAKVRRATAASRVAA